MLPSRDDREGGVTWRATILEIWSARLLRAFDKVNHWRMAAIDRSDEVPDGDMLHIGDLTTSVTVGNYTVDTDIATPQAGTDSDQVLALNQQKYFNIQVNDIDQVQARPDIMDEFARKAAVAVADLVNAFVYDTYTGNVGNARTGSISGANFGSRRHQGL